MTRRLFSTLAASSLFCTAQAPLSRKAAIIGHTGRGNYGHSLEKIFLNRTGLQTVAVADPDDTQRKAVQESIGALRSYADYRELLLREKPDLVCVGMRHSDQHFPVIMACLEAGAHVYSEKPFVLFPAEADAILAKAKEKQRVVAVAHTMRNSRPMRELLQAVEEGLLGEIVELRCYGKQDHRAGGEDLMVLGSHLMDLMRAFAGDPLWCEARVTQKGKDITKKDARHVKDEVGLVAGDTIFANYAFKSGVLGTFTSTAALKDTIGHWGIEIYGSKGMARMNCDIDPHAFLRRDSKWDVKTGGTDTYVPLTPEFLKTQPKGPFDPVSDWLAAIDENRHPVCSAQNAAWAIEMVLAVYHAALEQKRVEFPLLNRQHPLG
jgi:predicted dehydrogenase